MYGHPKRRIDASGRVLSDAISRIAVLNAISKSTVIPCHEVVHAICELPALDVAPVVRCKDCNRFMPYTEAHRKASGFDGDCAFLAGYADCDRECVYEMDFCSRGARMDGEEE